MSFRTPEERYPGLRRAFRIQAERHLSTFERMIERYPFDPDRLQIARGFLQEFGRCAKRGGLAAGPELARLEALAEGLQRTALERIEKREATPRPLPR